MRPIPLCACVLALGLGAAYAANMLPEGPRILAQKPAQQVESAEKAYRLEELSDRPMSAEANNYFQAHRLFRQCHDREIECNNAEYEALKKQRDEAGAVLQACVSADNCTYNFGTNGKEDTPLGTG